MNITRSGKKYTSVGAAVEVLPANYDGSVSNGAFLIGQGGVSQPKGHGGEVVVDPDSVTWKVKVFPASLKVGLQDVDLDSGRNAAGWMVRHKKAIKRTISAELPPMTTAEISPILKAIDPIDVPVDVGGEKKLVEFFAVKYLDPWDGGYRTGAFYSGDREAPMYNGVLNLWEGLPLEFVEM